jgi:hypothetical protein
MSEMTFDSMQALFSHIHSRGGANPVSHGMLGNFYALMAVYTNPNTCSCKKGRAALNNIMSTCKSLSGMTGEALSNSKAIFDNKTVIVKENGTEFARF